MGSRGILAERGYQRWTAPASGCVCRSNTSSPTLCHRALTESVAGDG